jgi:ankyrin repeat protein/predicted DNA-binding WGR domain protein
MVLVKAGADITLSSKSKLTPLHFACIRGATISALTLMNNGADSDAQDYFETTAYGYALKNNHEDLCIFLIQQEQNVDTPINEIVEDKTHVCNMISQAKGYINSAEVEELLEKQKELDKKNRIDQIEEGYMKLKSYSPFYYAIKNNMQGNIYLLLQKGFDQYSALAESIIHNKYNFFISVLDSIDTKNLNKKSTSEGKNLMHILAEHTRESSVDCDLLNDVYKMIVDFKIDIEAEDNEGRIPLHYALKSQNLLIATNLLSGKTDAQIVKLCNSVDHEGISALGMLYNKLSKNEEASRSPLNVAFINLFGPNIKQMNPFITYKKLYFPYTFLSFVVEDGTKIHPLILMMESCGGQLETLQADIVSADLDKVESEDGLTLIDWLFKLSKLRFMKHQFFKTHIENYLKDKKNVKKVEEILSTEIRPGVYLNIPRIVAFAEETFSVKLNVKIDSNPKQRHKEFSAKTKKLYDYEADSEKVLDKKIPVLEKELQKEVDKKGKALECVLDSNQGTEKHCLVVKDENETGYYYDAVMKKVDIKKYYYGLDNFYVVQLLKDDVKNLYILWTRWGRSGSYGQYQRTPFNSLEEAKKEFQRVFKQKSGWTWKEVNDYAKLPKKYELKRISGKLISKSDNKLKFSNRDIDYNKLVVSIDDIESKIKMKCSEGIKEFMDPLLTDTQQYQTLKNSQFQDSLMLFTPKDRPTIDKGLEILDKMKAKLAQSKKYQMKSNFADFTV